MEQAVLWIGLIYVALKNPEISRRRVACRVSQGGHNVPAEKLEARWNRSIENLRWFAQQASRIWVVDNSDSTLGVPPRLIAEGRGGAITILDPDAIPEITRTLLADA